MMSCVKSVSEPGANANIKDSKDESKNKDEEATIVLVLDESGSMGTVRDKIISSVNNFVNSQKKVNGKCNYTLIKFSNNSAVLCNNVPISEAKDLDKNTYMPDGMTALYDAVGMAFDMYKDKKNVVLIIVTDGCENSSMTYTKTKIKILIDEYTDKNKHGWNVIYLASDPFLQKQGEEIGIGIGRMATTNVAVDFNNDLEKYSTRLGRAVSNFVEHKTENVVMDEDVDVNFA